MPRQAPAPKTHLMLPSSKERRRMEELTKRMTQAHAIAIHGFLTAKKLEENEKEEMRRLIS